MGEGVIEHYIVAAQVRFTRDLGITTRLKRLLEQGPSAMARPSEDGLLATSGYDYTFRCTSDPSVDRPDLVGLAVPFAIDPAAGSFPPHPADHPGMLVGMYQQRPETTGSVHASSTDPEAPPVITPDYLQTPTDTAAASRMLGTMREFLATGPLADVVAGEDFPTDAVPDDPDSALQYALQRRNRRRPRGRFVRDGTGGRPRRRLAPPGPWADGAAGRGRLRPALPGLGEHRRAGHGGRMDRRRPHRQFLTSVTAAGSSSRGDTGGLHHTVSTTPDRSEARSATSDNAASGWLQSPGDPRAGGGVKEPGWSTTNRYRRRRNMKFLVVSTNTKDVLPFVAAEVQRVAELRAAGTITHAWVKSDLSGGVLILECADESEATAALDTLPTVINDATATGSDAHVARPVGDFEVLHADAPIDLVGHDRGAATFSGWSANHVVPKKWLHLAAPKL